MRIISLTVALSFLVSCSPDQSPSPPNILFIMADDHTSQAWGIYGGVLKDYVRTPNIQRLADEGAVLDNAFCTNSICVTSRAAILTGQYSHRNGVFTLADALSPDSMNISKVLQSQGYQTAIIGKWHLKKQPAGFDDFLVLPGQGRYHNPVLKSASNWEDGNQGGVEFPGFSSDVIADFSIDWLDGRDPDRPFFLMTHFKATHEPFDYPERHKDLLVDVELPEPETLYDFGPETNGRTFIGQKLDNLGWRWEQATADPDGWWTTYPGMPFSTEGLDSIQARKKIYQKFVKDFIRCGTAIDDNIGKLLDYLDQQGLADNTVVIYTADQGYFMGEHGFFDKRMMYEESLRMPFVMRYPPEIPAGTRIDDMVLNIDFPAIFADYAGLDPLPFVQGSSFRSNVAGKTPSDWRKSMYYRYWAHAPIRPGHFGVRNHRYKLIFFYGHPLGLKGAQDELSEPAWEFFDLEKDPHENRNAYGDPEYARTIRELKQELIQLRDEVGDKDSQFPAMKKIIEENWDL